MVVSSSASLSSVPLSPHLVPFQPKATIQVSQWRSTFRISNCFLSHFVSSNCRRSSISCSGDQTSPRTLFPGGYKLPEIKVPSLVLLLSSDEVLKDGKTLLHVVDDAVSGRVGIVVLTAGSGSGKMLYEAACLLKSVIKVRAYLLIDERVDIAAAVKASGVLLSDQGLPTIMARNAMMEAKTESVVLPLVARNVQSFDAAMDASSFEGADFLIFDVKGDSLPGNLVSSVVESENSNIYHG